MPEIKDSGRRKKFESGMQRDVTEDKTDYSLVLDGPMFERWAQHMTNGAKKYDKRNWMKASGQEELERFRESAVRHFILWYQGLTDEDHAAAVLFNISGAEYVRSKSPYEVRSAGLSDMPVLQVQTPEAPEPSDVDAVPEVRSPYAECDCAECLNPAEPIGPFPVEPGHEGSTEETWAAKMTAPLTTWATGEPDRVMTIPPGIIIEYTPGDHETMKKLESLAKQLIDEDNERIRNSPSPLMDQLTKKPVDKPVVTKPYVNDGFH